MNKGFSIAIDGPVAAGKGTVAIALANALNGFPVNTGAMYRCVAFLCIQNKLDMKSQKEVIKVLPQVNVKFKEKQIILNGVDVTERLKDIDVAKGSSVVAVHERVRQDLVKKQQKIAHDLISKGKIVILDGRDIGTKVLPDADFKMFLTALVEVRAKRSLGRYKQKGIIKIYKEVLEETKERDYRDSHRDVDPLPLKPEEFGYWILDNSKQTEDDTINTVLEKLKQRRLINDQH